jgi:hypothetical protein
MALTFALAITTTAGVLAGLLPALSASGGSVLSALRENARGTANNLSFLVSREHRTRSGSSHSRIHDQPRI